MFSNKEVFWTQRVQEKKASCQTGIPQAQNEKSPKTVMLLFEARLWNR